MILDVCSQHSCSYEQAERDVALTSAWAKRSKKYLAKRRYKRETKPLTFAIVQGSRFKDLRQRSTKELVALDFDGYAIGGVAVGESEAEMLRVVENTVGAFRGTPLLPEEKPCYLMGVGYPHQIVEAVKRGIDMFDCVIPTREARHGRLYQFRAVGTTMGLPLQNKKFYHAFVITKSLYKKDMTPINPDSKIPLLRQYSKAYLRHLFDVQEPLALTLATMNNVEFYLELMRKIRREIRKGKM
ncbi:MAG: Queuine tRNA-ribosyltransferase [Parcubacteria group bacterium GW2011_GWA2_44_12]|nr:MAG: Queuine tRNA-ribosyltransferase [Parcubacteria group bacterium GW2011_GWA2_44_12]